MNYLEINGNWFNRRYPDLWKRITNAPDDIRIEISPSRSGAPSLRIGSIQVHSSYDPVREADTIAEKALAGIDDSEPIVICGFGLGYVTEAIQKRHSASIIVVEQDFGIFRKALENRDLQTLSDLDLIIGDDIDNAVDQIRQYIGSKPIKFIEHAPSVKLHSGYYEELMRRCNSTGKLGSTKLNILVATPMYGGSLPIARYCASAFEKLGHRVFTLDNEIYNAARQQIEVVSSNRQHRGQLMGLLTTLMSESITAKALDRAIDLVFLVAQSPMTPQVIEELKRHHIPTAFWFVEDWQLFTYWKDWAPLYDYFFTIQQGGFSEALKRIDVKRSRYLPLAADPNIHRPLELSREEALEFGSAVSHVGAGYRNRHYIFAGMTDLDFKLWGNGWDETSSLGSILQRNGARLTTEESVKVFNATAVNINLHSSAFHEDVNPDGDYLNPRTFELAACGAFQLTDHRSLMSPVFEEGSEIITFRSGRELRSLTEYYIDHPEERNEIADRARKRVLAEHTYEQRMAEVLEYVFSYEAIPAGKRHPNHIDTLMDGAEEDEELRELLDSYKERGVVTIDDIAEEIQKDTGELTTPEAIFLLMYEFRNWARDKELM